MSIKFSLGLSVLVLFAGACPRASTPPQTQMPQTGSVSAPVTTTVCAIVENPKSFAGKTVSVHATIIINHIYEGIADPVNCRGKEVFLGDSDAKQRDAAMKQFESALHAQFVPLKKQRGLCMYDSCHQYTVSATLVGVLDYPIAELGNTSAGRLELVSVTQVTPTENQFDPKILQRP